MNPKNLEKILNAIENFDEFFGEKYVAPEYIQAWELNKKHGITLNPLPPKSREFICNLITEKKPKVILEIGTGAGGTTICIAEKASFYGGEITTFERSAPKAEIARVHIKISGLQNILLFEKDAMEVINSWNKPIDLLFLDADRKHYLDFFMILEKHFQENCIILADNVLNYKRDVINFINHIASDSHYDSSILPIDNGLLYASKKNRL